MGQKGNTMSQHTVGPWKAFGPIIRSASGPRIGKVEPINKWEANARLIAAAPELLKAAQALVDHLSQMENGKWLNNKPGADLKTAIERAVS